MKKLLICLLSIFILGCFVACNDSNDQSNELNENTPVYTGMTVSNEFPSDSSQEQAFANKAAINRIHSYRKFSKGGEHKPGFDLNGVLEVEGSDRSKYYANKGEDIYITIHINNPRQFDILSFTLNGMKYQSYMFEDGSNSENLILKLNVGEAEGMVEYTIDEIKYVEGTEIKNAVMKGDKTVSVGICPDAQPTAQISLEKNELTSISFNVNITDENSLISDSDGAVYMVLLNGDEVPMAQKLAIGKDSTVTFTGISPETTYNCIVVGYYDALDGNGFAAHGLYEEELLSTGLVTLKNVCAVNDEKITFDLTVLPGYNINITKIELIDSNGTVVCTEDADAREFDNLKLYIGSYTVSATYSYSIDGTEHTDVAIGLNEITVSKIDNVSKIVSTSNVTKEFFSDMQIYNPSTSDYRSHWGIDITPDGDDKDVCSAAAGTVKSVSYDSLFGWTVVISSNISGNTVDISYQCLAENSITVSVGDKVCGGQIIGTVGSSYVESVEPEHLHLAISENGTDIDPNKYVVYK